MKAMVLTAYNRPLEYLTVDDPRPGDDDIILKVRAAGMCSTDLKIASGRLANFITLPHIPGHEIAGDIVDKGKNVIHLELGERGTAYPVISCGRCSYCLTGNENLCLKTVRLGFEADGGFAEYVRMPASNFCPAGTELPPESLAVLADAVGTPYHALTRIARPVLGKPIMITGAGGLGLNAVQIAKGMGSFVIACDIRKEALSAAEKCGADLCIDLNDAGNAAESVLEATGGAGVDIVLEGVGRQETFSFGLGCLKKQGTLIVMGYNPELDITVPFIDLHNKELKVAGTKICTRQDLIEVIDLVEKGAVVPEITETMPLHELNAGLEAVRGQKTVGRTCISF